MFAKKRGGGRTCQSAISRRIVGPMNTGWVVQTRSWRGYFVGLTEPWATGTTGITVNLMGTTMKTACCWRRGRNGWTETVMTKNITSVWVHQVSHVPSGTVLCRVWKLMVITRVAIPEASRYCPVIAIDLEIGGPSQYKERLSQVWGFPC